MAQKYFISISPGSRGSHRVHRKDCPFLPESHKRIFLGIFHDPHCAIREAHKFFDLIDGCIFCSKEKGSEVTKQKARKINLIRDYIITAIPEDCPESVLLCCVN
jgi:hypothetical protein